MGARRQALCGRRPTDRALHSATVRAATAQAMHDWHVAAPASRATADGIRRSRRSSRDRVVSRSPAIAQAYDLWQAWCDSHPASRAIFTTPLRRALSLAEKAAKHDARVTFNLQAEAPGKSAANCGGLKCSVLAVSF